ncbi:nucleobase:cation symporter-2 family protein [Methylobacterium indicum]|uniref:Purine permease n=1 Tax=Methylobacterium indicum TaxID=1775910 RepID=A0A8H8WZ39_9HYPH|nr:nucleobase:cation symporter-2 family protein [Methylobacterium indicum]BCM87325.1 purine permease [Methylobacterium indicum]
MPVEPADAVEERLPPARLLPLALQHVLVMYAGAVAVPLIVGRALGLPPEDVAVLISADLFACGLATLIQSAGFPGVGIRLPVMMGVTFASVGPMLSMAATPGIGLLGIYGSVIAAGLFGLLVAPYVSRLLPLFPPVVTGTIILVIGISLMRVGINWAGGGQPTITRIVDGMPVAFPNPAYAQPGGLGIAFLVLLTILALIRWGRGFLANVAVLAGIVAGSVLAACLGLMHVEKVAAAAWFAPVLPFHFGWPHFHLVPVATMCVVMIVVMIESTGMFLALGEITGRPVSRADLARGLRADGLGTLVGGVFNTFPYTSFSQNVGLVGVTGVRSRFVTVAGGVVMLALGLLPKMAALVEAVPQVVLGGAGLVMFGMVAATGARILTAVDFRGRPKNQVVVAVAVGFGLIPLVAPTFFRNLPHALHPLLESGILLASIAAVLLNAFFNGVGSAERAGREASATAAAVEHV